MMRFLSALLVLCLPAAATAPSQKQALFELAKRAVEGFDGKDRSAVLSATWPDGYYIQVGASPLKRHWKDVPFSGLGVNSRTEFGKPVISLHGNRADIKVRYNQRIFYDVDDAPRECGSGTYHFDLRRRHGEWRIRDLTVAVIRSRATCRRSEEKL